MHICGFRATRTKMKMKQIYLALALAALSGTASAGGYLTNTNQHIAFLRNPARNASIEIDALYSNPAGIAFLKEGWHLSLNLQSAYQNRDIWATYAPFALNADGHTSSKGERLFSGRAAAPVIPSVMLAYKRGAWTFGGHFAVAGGGGRAKFESGLPMFEKNVALLPGALNQFIDQTKAPLPKASAYSLDSHLKGKQYVFSGTIGAAYRINEQLSVYAGVRANIASNAYSGYIRNIQLNMGGNMVALSPFLAKQAETAKAAAAQFASVPGQEAAVAQYTRLAGVATQYAKATADKEVELTQSGFGLAPILGVNYKLGDLHLAAKYEFGSKITVKNKTTKNELGVPAYDDKVETGNDVPALLSLGASYSILPSLRVSAGYHHYFDKQANMAQGKEKLLKGNTNEWLAGIEYDLNQKLTLSLGGQLTTYRPSDAFQSDLAFYNNSYSIGTGFSYKFTEHIKLNVAYFFTDYKDYSKTETDPQSKLNLHRTYKRTNHVFGLGVDFNL